MKAQKTAAKIGKSLLKKAKTLALAESCTGGYISHLITLVPGSSVYFMGGIIAYDNAVKTKQLGVKPNTIKKFGAVSAECAAEMVAGTLKNFKSDYAIATTGIAGPGGAVKGKPVGTVYIAFGTKNELFIERCSFKGSRKKIIEQTAKKALEMLLSAL